MNDTIEISSNDRLGFTFFITVAAHVFFILSVGWTVDKGSKVAPVLNITVATQKSNVEPEKADFLAQQNQKASGSAEEVRELTTREVAMIDDTKIRDVTDIPQQKAQQKTERELHLISTTSKSERKIADEKLKDEKEELENRQGEEIDTANEDLQLASLNARLDELRQQEANRPRIRRLTSVDTKYAYDAKYLHDWAQKVETIGNQNFPELALRKEIFGDLLLVVTILPSGFVERVEVRRSSGHHVLDEAARHIVKLASPFAPFPKEIRKKNDKIEIIRTWRFEITGLTTTQ